MEFTLTFTERQRYNKALAIIDKNPRYTALCGGRIYAHNPIRPWSTLFYITFRVEVTQ